MNEPSEGDAVVPPTCSSCGASLAPDDRYCESCGATIDGSDDGSLEPRRDSTTDGDGAADTSGAAGAGDGPATAVVRAPGAAAPSANSAGGRSRRRVLLELWRPRPDPPGPLDRIPALHGSVGCATSESATPATRTPCRSGSTTHRPIDGPVLVVCDGVTTAPHSDRASLAAAGDATHHMMEVLSATGARSMAGAIESATDALVAGCHVAQVAVLGVTRDLGNPTDGPSCTFAAAIVAGGVLAAGWCGDSRVYWMPDGGPARQPAWTTPSRR